MPRLSSATAVGSVHRTCGFWLLAAASCFAAAVSVNAAAYSVPPAEGEKANMASASCNREVIPFERVAHAPTRLQLTGVPGLSLRQTQALRISRAASIRFTRFEPGHTTGILRSGCVLELWWSRSPGPYRVEEVRLLGPVEALGTDYSYLRLPADPEPRWTPAFRGYRHVMSSELSPPGLSYIGLWHRTDGRPGSLVAAYNVDGTGVLRLGAADWNYDGVYAHFSMHAGLYGFTLLDEPEGSDPLYMLVYDWEYRGTTAQRRR